MRTQQEVEQQILGAIITDLNAAFVCMDHLKPEHFNSDKNANLFRHLCEAAATLPQSNESDVFIYLAKRLGKDDHQMHEVVTIAQRVPSAANIEYFIGELLNYSRVRRLVLELNTVINEVKAGEVEFQPISERLEKLLLNLNDVKRDEINIETVVEETLTSLQTQNDISGYSWGLHDLDKLTGGIEPLKTYVIGGLKKSGKTKFALNTTLNLIDQHISVGWISLEMGRNYLMRWILSHIARVDSSLLKNGQMSKGNMDKIEHAAKKVLVNQKLFQIDDRPGLSISQIRATIRRFAMKGCQVVFLDYLQRITTKTDKGENRATAVQKLAIELADIAKEYGVALVYLSQLNNSAEGRKAGIGDLKESGGIGEAVDCSIVINNMDRINKKKEKTNIACFVVEQRDGASDEVEFYMELAYSRFSDLTRKYNDEHETAGKYQKGVPF